MLAKRGPVAYELALLAHIRFHNVFHASLLNKYVYDTKHVIDWSLLLLETEGEFPPKPIHILDERGGAQDAHHSSVERAMEAL